MSKTFFIPTVAVPFGSYKGVKLFKFSTGFLDEPQIWFNTSRGTQIAFTLKFAMHLIDNNSFLQSQD